MDEWIFSLPFTLQSLLDTIVSARTSVQRRTRSLTDLEHLLAKIFTRADPDTIETFCALQDSFECNIPSRLLFWMSGATTRLDSLLNRGHEKEQEMNILMTQLLQCMSIMQGVVLTHPSSKAFMGRKYPLETLLDLLYVSRHIPNSSKDQDASVKSTPSRTPSRSMSYSSSSTSSVPLASVVLDTLLCVLVDAPIALRVFEDVDGIQVIVKLLKRANTPKEVKMKCLEFLYFYLMDESSPSNNLATTAATRSFPVPPTAPTGLLPSPTIPESKTRQRSTGHVAREASTSSDDSYTSGISQTSSASLTSATSAASSSSTLAPRSPTSLPLPKSPPHTPPNSRDNDALDSRSAPSPFPSSGPTAKPRSLLMLRRDVDFVPLTPKKGTPLTRLGHGHGHSRLGSITNIDTTPISTPRARRPLSAGTSTDAEGDSGSASGNSTMAFDENSSVDGSEPDLNSSSNSTSVPRRDREEALRHLKTLEGNVPRRTTEEKKKLLGTMLGNVDALVEGVRKAGVWGLG